MEGDFEGGQQTSTTVVDTHRSTASSSVPNFNFIRTPSGIAMVVNIVFLFVSWVIIAGWDNSVPWTDINGSTNFFYWSTVFPFVVLLLVMILYILNVPKNFTRINWPFSLMVCCAFWSLFLLIASCIIASHVRKFRCDLWNCDTLGAAAAFGFFSMFGLIVEGLLHYREFKGSGEDWKNVGFIICC